MPLITIKLFEGRTQAQKKAVVEGFLKVLEEELGSKPEHNWVIFDDTSRGNGSLGRKAKPRSTSGVRRNTEQLSRGGADKAKASATGIRKMLGFIEEHLLRLQENGEGMPPFVHSSPEIFAFENAKVLGATWTCFTPLKKLKEPGSVVVGQVGKTPVLVTRIAA